MNNSLSNVIDDQTFVINFLPFAWETGMCVSTFQTNKKCSHNANKESIYKKPLLRVYNAIIFASILLIKEKKILRSYISCHLPTMVKQHKMS